MEAKKSNGRKNSEDARFVFVFVITVEDSNPPGAGDNNTSY
jgi:hypothetical protein